MKPPESSSAAVDPTALLRDERALRALARGVLGDPHGAEDAVQETWLAVLRHPPRGERSGPWLRRVAGNAARRLRRSERARRRREERVARPEAAVPSPEELLLGESARRTLIEAVLALEEPYRSSVALRYLDGLPPRAVAGRLGVPVETVRTRIQRGLALLRERLEAEFGEGSALRARLVPLWPVPRGGRRAAGVVLGWTAALGLAACGALALSLIHI